MKTLAKVYKKQFGNVEFPFEIYDANGNETYWENSDGNWIRWEYDAKGNKTYNEDSNDYWVRREYDAKGNWTYREDSYGYWWRKEYDAKGNETYRENSAGEKWGTPKNSCSGKIVQIEGKKYQLKEVK